jgi:glycosyltransferase involved in cell wall biosynthesis
MFNGQKIVVVMPAYNAARTLRGTYDGVMAQGMVDLVIVVPLVTGYTAPCGS